MWSNGTIFWVPGCLHTTAIDRVSLYVASLGSTTILLWGGFLRPIGCYHVGCTSGPRKFTPGVEYSSPSLFEKGRIIPNYI